MKFGVKVGLRTVMMRKILRFSYLDNGCHGKEKTFSWLKYSTYGIECTHKTSQVDGEKLGGTCYYSNQSLFSSLEILTPFKIISTAFLIKNPGNIIMMFVKHPHQKAGSFSTSGVKAIELLEQN